jgi:hypothetical protein
MLDFVIMILIKRIFIIIKKHSLYEKSRRMFTDGSFIIVQQVEESSENEVFPFQ